MSESIVGQKDIDRLWDILHETKSPTITYDDFKAACQFIFPTIIPGNSKPRNGNDMPLMVVPMPIGYGDTQPLDPDKLSM
jgi:hypothetical protein